MTSAENYVKINRLALRCLNYAQEYINLNKITCNIGYPFKEALFQEVEIFENKFTGYYEYNTSCHCHPEYKRYYLTLPSSILDIEDGPEYEEDEPREIAITKIIEEDKLEYDNKVRLVNENKQKKLEIEQREKARIKELEEKNLFLNLKQKFGNL